VDASGPQVAGRGGAGTPGTSGPTSGAASRATSISGSRAETRPDQDDGFVVASAIAIGELGVETLEEAFRHRLGEVDDWPGFRRLEVWRDGRSVGRYLMVSWWDSREQYAAYMRSESHRRSHARIPEDPERPRPVSVDLYEVVAR
jgi:heme-degrading monooxygenase HmoA